MCNIIQQYQVCACVYYDKINCAPALDYISCVQFFFYIITFSYYQKLQQQLVIFLFFFTLTHYDPFISSFSLNSNNLPTDLFTHLFVDQTCIDLLMCFRLIALLFSTLPFYKRKKNWTQSSDFLNNKKIFCTQEHFMSPCLQFHRVNIMKSSKANKIKVL